MNPLVLFAACTRSLGAGGLSRHPNQKEKARVEETEASRGERERNLNGRRTGWLELVGVGRLVWPTGADTRRKHARRNVARFVASCTYRYTCTGHVHGGRLACTYGRVSQGERTDRVRCGRVRRRRSEERKAWHGPKGNCAPLAGTVHGAVIATISRVYRICIRECRPKRAVRSDTHTFGMPVRRGGGIVPKAEQAGVNPVTRGEHVDVKGRKI